MAYDYKREFPALYRPTAKPALVDVPPMTFAAVAGTGDPNEEGGAYAQAVGLLYAFSYAVKMAKMGPWQPHGYFDFVVPPLEGLWWGGTGAFDGSVVADKSALCWVALIRQPDFVTNDAFARLCERAAAKKPELAEDLAAGKLRRVRFAEGLCAQIMHRGPYDDEPATIARLGAFVAASGKTTDITGGSSPHGHAEAAPFSASAALDALDTGGLVPSLRLHHEIYLGDPRRTAPDKLRTVIRHPVREAGRPA